MLAGTELFRTLLDNLADVSLGANSVDQLSGCLLIIRTGLVLAKVKPLQCWRIFWERHT